MIGGVPNGHFPQGGAGQSGGSPTDMAQCPLTDTVSLGGGKDTRTTVDLISRESQHVTLDYAAVTLRFLNR